MPRQPDAPSAAMPQSWRIAVLEPREEPDAGAIVQELRDAVQGFISTLIFDKLKLCHETNRCFWEGQQEDGRVEEIDEAKDRRLFRWRGAPDLRIPVADKLVREHVLIDMAVWNRGQMTIRPLVDKNSGSPESAASWQDVMEHFMEKRKRQRAANVKLWRTTIHEFGYGVLYGNWRGEKMLLPHKLSFDSVLQTVLQMKAQALLAPHTRPDGSQPQIHPQMMQELQLQAQGELDLLLLDKELKPQIIALIQAAVMNEDEDSTEPISTREAGRIVTQFRSGKKNAEYFRETEGTGWPVLKALVLGVNYLHGMDLTGDGEGAWHALPERLCEADLRERAQLEDWDNGFLLQVLNHPNKSFNELQNGRGLNLYGWAFNGAGIGLNMDTQLLQRAPMYQVFYVCRKAVNSAGVATVYWSLVHPLVNDCLGFHRATGLTELPFRVETREPVTYAWQSRGIPEIVVDKQNAKKDLLDGEGARAQLGSNPPFRRTMANHVGIAPGIELQEKRSGKNEGSMFVEVPQVDQGAFKMCEVLDMEIDQYFFRGQFVDPEMKQAYREGLANEAIGSYQTLWQLMWQLIQANVDKLKVSRIAGRNVDLQVAAEDLEGEADIVVSFNSASFSPDSADNFVNWLSKMSAIDRAGTVDWAEAAKEAAMLWNPAMARRLIMPADAATKGIVEDQNRRITQIMAAIPLSYEKQTSNPELRQQTLQSWLNVPGNVMKVQRDPVLLELLQKEMDYLSFQLGQYGKNRLTGQTGVEPNDNPQTAALTAAA